MESEGKFRSKQESGGGGVRSEPESGWGSFRISKVGKQLQNTFAYPYYTIVRLDFFFGLHAQKKSFFSYIFAKNVGGTSFTPLHLTVWEAPLLLMQSEEGISQVLLTFQSNCIFKYPDLL